MTIASQTSRINYTGDGVTTAFAVPFYFAANADLVVVLQDTLGAQTTQLLGTHYSLTGATLAAGGTCTFVAAPTTGYLVTIYRDPAVTQTASYNNNDPFPAKSHELALDKLTTIAQRLKDIYSRAIKQTDGEATMTTTLAAPAVRKNKLLGFGSDGSLAYVTGPTFVNSTSTGVAEVDSRSTAQVTTFPISVNLITTKGLLSPGDGGGADYVRGLVGDPGAFQDAGGVYWKSVIYGVADVESRTTAALKQYPSTVSIIATRGLTTPGDGGGRTYKRGISTNPGAFQDAAGTYWVFDNGSTLPSGSAVAPPQGRLTVTSGVPVPTSSVTSAPTLYYTPYGGQQNPIYDGSSFIPFSVAEISLATSDATKSPAACANNSNYDVFLWSDAGTVRISRGPVWTNDTTRSAGTALTLVNGIYLNSVSITNGPAASRGTYLGTIRTNGTATINYIFGGFAAATTAADIGIWNAYNRVPVYVQIGDSTASWTYTVANTWRAANGSATARASVVRGFDVDQIVATYFAVGGPGAATSVANGIGVNSTTVFSGTNGFETGGSAHPQLTARYAGLMGVGYVFVAPLEYNTTTTASTWYGGITVYSQANSFNVELLQ